MLPTNSLKSLLLGLTLLLLSCSRNEEGKAYESYKNASPSADTVSSENFLSSSAAVEKNKDSLRKFIRTADLKFRAKDVLKVTYQIEDIAAKFGGFVTYTNLTSNMDYHTVAQVSKDSSLESTHYTVINTMTLRVPNTKLDSTLKSIGALVDYMDFRVIRANDVGLSILSNKLTQERTQKHEKRITEAIDKKGKKLWETTDAEDDLFYRQEQADNALIANYSMMDQIQYSTVSLNIYQKQAIKHELIANNKNIASYEPAFHLKLMDSLYSGWEILEAFILFVVRLWGLLIFFLIAYLIYRKFKPHFIKK